MKSFTHSLLGRFACLLALATSLVGLELPAGGTSERPLYLLQVGREAAVDLDSTVQPILPQPPTTDREATIVMGPSETTLTKPGFGSTSSIFRYLVAKPVAGRYTFWMRWRQGGDPAVCQQDVQVWAGPEGAALERRHAVRLHPSGWKARWVQGGQLELSGEEGQIEIRVTGAAQDAKVFEGFVLAPPQPPPELAVPATREHPALVLQLGNTATWPVEGGDPTLLSIVGTAGPGPGAESVTVSDDSVTVRHRGNATWGAVCSFTVNRPLLAGLYSFHARYMTGGEASQTRQTFVLRAGTELATLGTRGTLTTHNRKPWQMQWSSASGTIALFPSDSVIEVINSGTAHDAKVFSAFELRLETPFGAWMKPAQGVRRSAFLAAAGRPDPADRSLLLLDGPGPDEVLFDGLASSDARAALQRLKVSYIAGDEAQRLAADLNVPSLPTAVIIDSDQRVLGILHDPADRALVTCFIADPLAGAAPSHPDVEAPAPIPLIQGAPGCWLVAGGWPGRCGVGSFGLDAESTQRPNPGDPYAYAYYTDGQRTGRWSEAKTDSRGIVHLTQLEDDYGWGRGTAYAVAYLHAEQEVATILRYQHSGVESEIFLDGVPVATTEDREPPFSIRRPPGSQRIAERAGVEIHDDIVTAQDAQPAQTAALRLAPGWHCLIVKVVHRQPKGEAVFLAARFQGNGESLRSTTADPGAALGAARTAARLWPLLTLADIPGNLPRPGEPLTVVADLRRCPKGFPSFTGPYLPIAARLRIVLTDFDGNFVRAAETSATFPGIATVDLGIAPGPGYYALRSELRTADGQLIRTFAADGFSVVLGNASQRERLERKELWNSWYYALDEDWPSTADWLERTGLLKNVGSYPGVPSETIERWKDAQARGITLVADFGGDSIWMNNAQAEADKVMAITPAFTRYSKSVNEIDGRRGEAWIPVRNPETWVDRTRWQYEAVHRARPDAFFLGGSMYCSGKDGGRLEPGVISPRAWFRRCLELGLDQWVDAWDVHAYPQIPPRLEGPLSNSSTESELGVLDVYRELGRENVKPFFIGETGALPWHDRAGLRWQAASVAKMVAWANSRADVLGVAFCAAHHLYRETMEDYGMAHQPGEAALYTAGALIDGLPYQRLPVEDGEIQAARFGPTLIVWRADGSSSAWKVHMEGSGPWVVVDTVGRVAPLPVSGGWAEVRIGPSPLFLLSEADHRHLTRME